MNNFPEWYRTCRAAWQSQPLLTRWLLGLAAVEGGFLLLQIGDAPLLLFAGKIGGLFSGNRWLLDLAKSFGYLPVWIIIAVTLLVNDFFSSRHSVNAGKEKLETPTRFYQRGGALFFSAMLSGLAAEILKLIVRRERPQALLDFLPVYREWSGQWWQNGDLGMPSSHTATAFGAAFALLKIAPAQRNWWVALASACAVSRVVDQAHAPTDIYVGALIAYLVSYFWLRFCERQKSLALTAIVK